MYDDVPESSTRCHGTFSLPVPPPSPPTPPVSLEQLLAPLNAIMQRLAAIDEHQAGRLEQHQQPPESFHLDFLATHPLEFAETTDLLKANHWLQLTECKFGLLHCFELQKTLFTTQQLYGSTSVWWATYTATLQDNHQVSWNEFCKVFRKHHISAGIIRRKLLEFLHLKQGTDSVNEYIKKFNYLQQYGGYHVDTDERKANLFRNELSLQLQDCLVLLHDLSFDALVSAVIEQEDLYQAVWAQEEKMRKRALSGPLEDSTEGAPSTI
jgi:hypothetical protein